MYRLCGRYFQMSTPKENGGYFSSVVNLCVSVGFLFLITGTQFNVIIVHYTCYDGHEFNFSIYRLNLFSYIYTQPYQELVLQDHLVSQTVSII